MHPRRKSRASLEKRGKERILVLIDNGSGIPRVDIVWNAAVGIAGMRE